MSDILIRDMEMPTDCTECPCFNDEYGRCQTKGNWGKGRVLSFNDPPDWCPLAPVPPHGRLIDADALKLDLTRFYGGEVTAKRLIDEQPTIIPAEEGET